MIPPIQSRAERASGMRDALVREAILRAFKQDRDFPSILLPPWPGTSAWELIAIEQQRIYL